MAKAYSVDLRIRAIKAFEKGVNIYEICKQFMISRATCYRWISAYRKEKRIEPKPVGNVGHSHKIKPDEYGEFIEFVKKNGHMNSIQMSEKWGRGMTPKTMRCWMKKFGFTRKKNNFYTLKEAKQSENAIKMNLLH
jgi:transposase